MKKSLKINKKTNIAQAVFLLLSALIPLLVCSKCSPLYPFNDWPDVNMYFTLGKGLMRGQVPYVDLVEQKGPYLFIVSGIGYLLSHTGFHGYFLFEVLSMFCLLWFSCKTMLLYTKKPWVWMLPLFSTGIAAAKSFVHGGSLEELTLGIFAYSIYSLLAFLKEQERDAMPRKTLLINGLLAGVLLWSKFTLLGLYIAWAAVVFLVTLQRIRKRKKTGKNEEKNKERETNQEAEPGKKQETDREVANGKKEKSTKKEKELWLDMGIFLGAMAATTIPWLLYFGYHHAIQNWLQAYLWDNIFGYSAGGNSSMVQRLGTALLNGFRSVKDPENLVYGLFVLLGAAGYILFPGKKISLLEKGTVMFLGLGMTLGIFIGGTKHDYYGLPLAVFGMFFFVALSVWLEKEGKSRTALALLLLAAGTGYAYRVSPNTYLLSIAKEEMPQYRFKEQIEASGDTTLLNYGFLDGGFYTVLGETPKLPYYCTLNVNYEQSVAIQNRYVEQELTHWVVTWKAYTAQKEELEQLPVISEHYQLVDYLYFPFEGAYRTYALYEVKEK